MILQYQYCVNFELTRSIIHMEKTAYKFVWHYIKIFKWFLIAIGVLLVTGQTCRQFVPYYFSRLYDAVSTFSDKPEAWQGILFCILMAFVLQFVGQIIANSNFFIMARIIPQLRTLVIRDVFDYVNKHSIAFFTEEMAGNISNKVQQLQNGVCNLVERSMDAAWGFGYVIVGLVVLSSVSIWLTPVFVLWGTLVIFLGFYLGKKVNCLSKATGDEQSRANGMIVDSIANYSEIKSFANFRFERLNLLKALRLLRKTESKEQFGQGWVILIQHMTVVFSFFAFMLYSVWLFSKGILSAADFIFVNTLFMTMGGTIFNITWSYNNLLRVFGKITSALETLAVEPEIVDSPKAKSLSFRNAEITFENVGFAYKNRNRIFSDLNLTIRAGEKIGLVGSSGGGKSTFIKLLARYFDVTDGAIKINGTDIREMKQDSLHKAIATIPQDVCLFNRSLYENIRYGRTSATEKEIYAAAKKAAADEFICKFPDAYQTRVGDRGVVLSGGERQRIAIARAILKDAPILVFDEATSALDSKSEKHIQKSLSNLMKNKTVIAIAHRLSTLREMDRILVFDKGQIVEQGTHASLLRKKGVYYKLYNMQADGFVGINKDKS